MPPDHPTAYARTVPPCYNMHVTQRGIAYRLWQAIEDRRLHEGWTTVDMAEHLGLPRNTINRLKESPRLASARTVNTIADRLPMDRAKAYELAGLRPPSPGERPVSVREAIKLDPEYDDEQRETMLRLVDLIDETNRGRRAAG